MNLQEFHAKVVEVLEELPPATRIEYIVLITKLASDLAKKTDPPGNLLN